MKSLFSDLPCFWKHSSALVRVAVCSSGKFALHVFYVCVCVCVCVFEGEECDSSREGEGM